MGRLTRIDQRLAALMLVDELGSATRSHRSGRA
jgi:hypothetical protein